MSVKSGFCILHRNLFGWMIQKFGGYSANRFWFVLMQLQGCPFTCMRDKKFSLAWVNHFHIDLGSNPSYLCHQMACEVVTVHQRNEDSIKCTWVTERFLQVPLPGVLKSAIESLDSFLQTSGLDLPHKFLGCPSKLKRHSHGERQLWRLPHYENSKQNSIYCIRGT